MIHEFIIRVRILRLQSIQMKLLKEMDKQINDFYNKKCDKVDKTPMIVSQAIGSYIEKLEKDIV